VAPKITILKKGSVTTDKIVSLDLTVLKMASRLFTLMIRQIITKVYNLIMLKLLVNNKQNLRIYAYVYTVILYCKADTS
jgi:hypothetical protein